MKRIIFVLAGLFMSVMAYSDSLPDKVAGAAQDARSAYLDWKGKDATMVFPIVTDVHVNGTNRKFLHILDMDVALDSLFDFDFIANLGDVCTKPALFR